LRSAGALLRVPRIDLAVGAGLRVHIRARDVLLALKPPEELSALNVLPGRIAEIGARDGAQDGAQDGAMAEVRVDLHGETLVARVTRLSLDRLHLAPGQPVFAIIKAVAIDRRSLGQVRPAPNAIDLDEIAL
jgi:molybdate transport system ATP-binding protein